MRQTTDPTDREDPVLVDIIPDDPNKPYDIGQVIRAVVDDGEGLEGHAAWAQGYQIPFLPGEPIHLLSLHPL